MARLKPGRWWNENSKTRQNQRARGLQYLDKQMDWFGLARQRGLLDAIIDDNAVKAIKAADTAWEIEGLPKGRSMRIFLTGKHREESIAYLSHEWKQVYIVARLGEAAVNDKSTARILAWHGYQLQRP